MTSDKITQIQACLKNEQLVIFPTDTVLALSCLPTANIAIERIYQLKNRKLHKPLSILVNSMKQLEEIAILNKLAYQLIAEHSLEKVTLVCKIKDEKNFLAFTTNNTIGIRVTKHHIASKIIDSLNSPIIATSVNITGHPALYDTKDIPLIIRNNVDYILEGKSNSTNSSKVIDISSGEIINIR